MRRFLLPIALLSAVALMATSASAAQTKPHLSFVKGGGATIGFSTEGGSSPSDTTGNTQSLRINVPVGGGASAYTYGTDETLVGIRGQTLAGIDHLGFDSKGYLGNGAPRISLGTQDTVTMAFHTFFLSAFHCNDAIGGGWRTSDFADSTQSPGTSTGCLIFDQSGNTFTSVQDAGLTYPNDVVVSNPNDWFLIVDEPTVAQGPPASLTYVDRLTVENWMWTRGGGPGIVNCNTGFCV